jgi:hypothetical protein
MRQTRLIERLSDQGFGRPVTVSPANVMARLRLIAAAPVLIESGLKSTRNLEHFTKSPTPTKSIGNRHVLHGQGGAVLLHAVEEYPRRP